MMVEDKAISDGKDNAAATTTADPGPAFTTSYDTELAIDSDEELEKVERVYRKIDRRIIPREL